MCGISFYLRCDSHTPNMLDQSLSVIKHRGPDSFSTSFLEINDYYIGLGHVRLSIHDLTDLGSQPMFYEDSVVLAFNGEIYNFISLRCMLENRGYEFKSSSDTEVLLKLYVEFGNEAFTMIQGMFAGVILDRTKQILHVFRDTIGIKPLYFYEKDYNFFCSSEIKGLYPFLDSKLELDPNDVYEFFNNGFLYEPHTGYKGVTKIMPGQIITFDLKNKNKSVRNFESKLDLNTRELKFLLDNAVKSQLVSDVPLGVFFSGGTDSTIIAQLSEDTELFFASYDVGHSSDIDREYSQKIASYLNKKLVIHDISDSSSSIDVLLAQVKFVAENTEELISDYTFWSTFKLSQAAKKHGYTVMLSGMGGDEVFAGYPRYKVLKFHLIFKLLSPILTLLFKFSLFPKFLDKKFERLVSYINEDYWPVAYSRLLGYFSRVELKSMFGENEVKLYSFYNHRLKDVIAHYKGDMDDKVKMAQYLDKFGFLSHNLMVSDKASMLSSVELRVPLLSEALVSYGTKLKSGDLISANKTKIPLTEHLKSFLPSSLVNRPKTGFNPPLDNLITKIGRDRLLEELSDFDGIINPDFVKKIIDDHFENKANNSYKIWQVLYFKYWCEVRKNSEII